MVLYRKEPHALTSYSIHDWTLNLQARIIYFDFKKAFDCFSF